MSPALLSLLAHPDAALLAVVTGLLLLYLEFNVPGTVVPGSLGALSLMLGLFALSRMPLRPGALCLALAGLALLLLAIVSPRVLLPAALGQASLATSFLRLVDPSYPAGPVHPPVALLAALLFGTATVWLGRVALRARRNKRIVPQPITHPAE